MGVRWTGVVALTASCVHVYVVWRTLTYAHLLVFAIGCAAGSSGERALLLVTAVLTAFGSINFVLYSVHIA